VYKRQIAYISLLSNYIEKDPIITNSKHIPQLQINIYPNPTTGSFWLNSSEEVKHIEIYDTQGKLVKSQEIQAKFAEIQTQLAKGLYYLVSYTSQNQKNTQKLVIQ
jgi:hypothetical protein